MNPFHLDQPQREDHVNRPHAYEEKHLWGYSKITNIMGFNYCTSCKATQVRTLTLLGKNDRHSLCHNLDVGS